MQAVSAMQTEDPFLMEVQKVAKQITKRCLRRWDGFLAVRADKDSLGNNAGIWKAKFESVRSASMLLAFRAVNATLQKEVLRAEPGAPELAGCLLSFTCQAMSSCLDCTCAVYCADAGCRQAQDLHHDNKH